MRKDHWIALLVCVNVALLVGIFIATTTPKPAMAQGTGLNGNYLAVAGEIQDQYDAVYMIDMRSHILHAFQFDRGKRQYEYVAGRDLQRDFRNNRD